MKLEAFELAFLPSGDLLASTAKSVVRIDSSAKKVLSTRKAKLPAFAVTPAGAVFVAEANKVFECDASSLKTLRQVALPAGRGQGAQWTQLASSPDGLHLAGTTQDGTLHVLRLGTKEVKTAPPYGAAHRSLCFVSPTELVTIREGIAQVRSLENLEQSRDLEATVPLSGVGASGFFIGWDHTSTLSVVQVPSGKAGKVKVPHDGNGTSVVLIPGTTQALVSSGGSLVLLDVAKRKLGKRCSFGSPVVFAATADRVALCIDGELTLRQFPAFDTAP